MPEQQTEQQHSQRAISANQAEPRAKRQGANKKALNERRNSDLLDLDKNLVAMGVGISSQKQVENYRRGDG